jgi:hypothetical protein
MAAAFGIVKGDDRAKMRSVRSRLAALGYVRECSRCGGGGHYSYNQITGTRCFGCDGSGREIVRITPAVLAEAVARQSAGELDAYFAANKARGDAKRAIAPLLAAFDAEWGNGAVHTSYKAISSIRRDATFTSAQVVESADFRAAGMVNSLHSAACEIEFQLKRAGFDALAGVEAMRGVLTLLREVNAAWAAYDGEGRLSAR